MKGTKLNVRLLTLLVALVLVFTAFAGCSQDPPAGAEEPAADDGAEAPAEDAGEDASAADGDALEFVYVTQDIANPYFVEVYNGFVDKCNELGVTTQVLDAKYDVANQRSYVEDCVERGVDGIMITPLDENALTDLVDTAKERGIVVAAEAQPISNAQIAAWLDEYEYGCKIGEAAAQWINEKLDGQGKVLIVAQDDVEAVIRRSDGIQDTIAELCPDSELVARQNGSNTELAMKVTENILQREPGLNVICTCDDFGGIGAYEAVKGMGMMNDTFYIGGADATEEGIAKMQEEGSVYRSSISIFPYECGAEIAQAMYDYIQEGKHTASTETVVVERKYEPVWQDDVI